MVLGDVPRSERCRCGEKTTGTSAGFKVTPKAGPAPAEPQSKLRAWLSK